MQFIDLKKQYSLIKEDVDKRIHAVLDHGRYINGPEITELEEKLASFAGTKHCIACSSGTDALLIPLIAWGIGKGDAVFTTPFTFIATAEIILLAGATPVFVDIDPKTYNMDPDKLEEAIKKVKEEGKLDPKVVIPVDLFGLPADYGKIEEIACNNDLIVLEDAAQGFGGNINLKKSGSFGLAAATSFFPAKPLGGYGDGGAIFTDDDDLNVKMRSVRVHGMGEEPYTHVRVGLNGRLDSIQAAVLLAKLEIFDEELQLRDKVANTYIEELKEHYVTPTVPDGYFSAWAQFCILAENEKHRNDSRAKLMDAGIPTAVYYPIPLHVQEAFEHLGYKKGDFPISEEMSERIFALPMHPYLSDDEIKTITYALKK
jgi:dTDP-4-amino-4,6-dideoxygalactose transaminase